MSIGRQAPRQQPGYMPRSGMKYGPAATNPRIQQPVEPVDPGYGATPPGEADITKQYQELLALIQQQSAPNTTTDQYNQLMKMYQDQMASNAAIHQQIQQQYDPTLGADRHQQLMELYQPPQRRDTATHFWGY